MDLVISLRARNSQGEPMAKPGNVNTRTLYLGSDSVEKVPRGITAP
jgi:hypothetical protein